MSKIKSIKLLLIYSKSFSDKRVHDLGEYFVVVLTLVFFYSSVRLGPTPIFSLCTDVPSSLRKKSSPLPIFSCGRRGRLYTG